jgi:HlyD family secretion protein
MSSTAKASPVRLVTSAELPPSLPRPPHHHRLRPWLLGLLAGAAVAAVGTWLDYGLKARLPPAPTVMVAPLDNLPVAALVRARGTLAPLETRLVSQPIAGIIAEVRARPGDVVKAGQVLARFDSLALKAEMTRAEARLVAGEAAAFEAQVKLAQLGGGDSQAAEGDDDQGNDVEVARARLATATAEVNAREASYRLAARQVGQGTVRAPFDGVVLARRIEPGQVATGGAALFEVATRFDRLVVRTDIAESELARVLVGLPARFTVPAYPGRSFRATVSSLDSPRGGRLPVALEVDNGDGELAVGMTASVEIATAASSGMLRAPTAALAFVPRGMAAGGDERAVWIEHDGALRRVPVEVGAAEGGFVELRAPELRPGTSVALGYATAAVQHLHGERP